MRLRRVTALTRCAHSFLLSFTVCVSIRCQCFRSTRNARVFVLKANVSEHGRNVCHKESGKRFVPRYAPVRRKSPRNRRGAVSAHMRAVARAGVNQLPRRARTTGISFEYIYTACGKFEILCRGYSHRNTKQSGHQRDGRRVRKTYDCFTFVDAPIKKSSVRPHTTKISGRITLLLFVGERIFLTTLLGKNKRRNVSERYLRKISKSLLASGKSTERVMRLGKSFFNT